MVELVKQQVQEILCACVLSDLKEFAVKFVSYIKIFFSFLFNKYNEMYFICQQVPIHVDQIHVKAMAFVWQVEQPWSVHVLLAFPDNVVKYVCIQIK
jgi:hypothetical protein